MFKKRANWVTEESGKTIIGILVLIFLGFLLWQLISIINHDNQKQQAKSTLDRIVYEIKNLKDGQEKEVLIESPADWVIYSFEEKICVCPFSGRAGRVEALKGPTPITPSTNCPSAICENYKGISVDGKSSCMINVAGANTFSCLQIGYTGRIITDKTKKMPFPIQIIKQADGKTILTLE